ncbi:MAG: hypothetical protein KKC51_07330 [Verrucomicrobia bacterium]|nr:hypothetical protein [Verrucomicrobiota bacterium]
MKASIQTLLLFVDGLGLGPVDGEHNPLYSGACPHLARLLREEAVPIDAQLGVPGLPQSATGQAALLTGVNAPAVMGRHIEGLPGPRLKELVREMNLFSTLVARGYRATFANAYFTDDVDEVRARRHQSVTTVAALHGLGTVRDTAALLRQEAVYHDLTRRTLRERGFAGPLVTPAEAGRHLAALAGEHDFTLFEYFQTDRAGHGGDTQVIRRVLGELDEFLGVLLPFPCEDGRLFILTSDHGNIEDSSTHGHTENPVPFVALGAGAAELRRKVRSLTDITPALLELYP